MSPSPKAVVQTFDNYAKSQLTFVQNVAELASKPAYIECLYESHVVEIVLPLVTNINPTVRMNAVLCLVRLAGNSEPCAKQIVCSKSLLSRLLGQLVKENKYYKKNCMNLVKNLSKYSSAITEIVIKECGGIDAIFTCMKEFDSFVREAALQAITCITRMDVKLSQLIVDYGVLPQIVLCLKEQQQSLKLYALSALDEMAKNNEDLALKIVDVPTLPHVIIFLMPNFVDKKVQKSALILIKNIVKHSLYLTEHAIESNLFPEILLLMAHPDESIRNNSAKVIREVVQHSVQIAQMVVNSGGIDKLLNVISCSEELSPNPAVHALGYIAAMSPKLASAIIQSQVLMHLTAILRSDTDKLTKAGTVWTLGMIGQHSAEHARSICSCDAITNIINVYLDSGIESESRHKCIVALEQILKKCDDYNVLDKLLIPSTPTEIMIYILEKISIILPKNSQARRTFITNGHLKMIQNINPEVNSELFQVIKAINCCFPEDIIQMVAGDFPETVMKTVDKYVPQSECLFFNRQLKSDEQLHKSYSTSKTPLSGEESSFK
ncbi:sperm-associated antigen 6-like [Acyrthosiphon pisum]|uniref:Sperm-associated antigen 6 n=1 Tax=Acyrthosiphon pisum TaxID=7029 RepID=A0A8R2NJV8_ACYPI|nr:sperm-associated antigen 6-like [Acyrthosiphon pisum]|eukprot:XP_001945993.2 PREDICTED: sperm-associated antigen 6-like [Acyrthosiphon pisum]